MLGLKKESLLLVYIVVTMIASITISIDIIVCCSANSGTVDGVFNRIGGGVIGDVVGGAVLDHHRVVVRVLQHLQSSRSSFQLFFAAAFFVSLRGAFGHVPLRVLCARGRARRLGCIVLDSLRRWRRCGHFGQPMRIRPGRYLWWFDGHRCRRCPATSGAAVAAIIIIIVGRGRVTGR